MNDHHRPLCEQLMVLLLSDDGKPVAGTKTGYLLAGALLADLVVRGRVDLAGPGEVDPAGGVLVRSPMPTGDSLLDDALERVRRREGGRPSSVIRPLSKGVVGRGKWLTLFELSGSHRAFVDGRQPRCKHAGGSSSAACSAR